MRLQQGSRALPVGEPFDAGLAQIADAITVAGGYPLMLTTVDDQASVGQLEARFTAQREAEWAEFTADWGKYEAELDGKVAKGKLTLAELDEEEQSLERQSDCAAGPGPSGPGTCSVLLAQWMPNGG